MNFLEKIKFAADIASLHTYQHLWRSKVFCMAPWVQLHAQTDGKMAPCCMSSVIGGNEIGDLRVDSDLRNAWNSTNMKQLRRNMYDGTKSSICTNCYKYEELGKFSERMQYNQDFKRYYDRVKKMLKDGTVIENKIPIIDIRFSNKCNYKCRICNSDYSSLWYDEEIKMRATDPNKPKEVKAAANQEVFWESFKSLLPYVGRLHFAGGEPLFMDEHYEVLEHLISIGKADVNLTYNTNFSTLRYKKHRVIDLWNKFQKVDIWASLDGMGEKADYHRKGQKWKEVEENIRTLHSECPPAIFGVNVTVSIFNILHIPDFFRYMVDNKLVKPDRVNLYLLFYPNQFSITNLPVSVKEKVVTQFKEFEDGYLSMLPGSAHIRDHIKAVIAHMLSSNDSNLSKFQQSINAVDAIREEDFSSTFPELKDLMHLTPKGA